LQTLILHDTPVDDRGLAQILSHCPAIVHLDVANTKITDEALSATRFPPSLKTLNLGDGVSLEAADRLAAQLPRVSISFNGITIVTVRARRAFIARLRASGFGGGGSRRGSSTRSPTNSDTSSPTSSPINSGTSSRTNSGTSYRGLGRRVGND
jgi:hypothetical protein